MNIEKSPFEQIDSFFQGLSPQKQSSALKYLQNKYSAPKTSKKRKYEDIKDGAVQHFKTSGSGTVTAAYINEKYKERGIHIDESYIRRWSEAALSEEEIKQIKKKVKISRGPGCNYPELEVLLFDWFKMQRNKKISVSLKDFQTQAKSLFQKLAKDYEGTQAEEKIHLKKYSEGSFTASRGWFQRFRLRKKISKRMATNIASTLTDNYTQDIALNIKRLRYVCDYF